MSVVVTIYSIGAIVFVSVCSFCSHLFWIIFADSFFVHVYFYFRAVTASAAAAAIDAEVLDGFAIVVLFMLLSELSYIYSRLSFGLVWYRRVVHCTQVHYSVRIGVRVTQPSLVEL